MNTASFTTNAARKIQRATQEVLSDLDSKKIISPRDYQHREMVLVAIIGIDQGTADTSGGYYQGSILFGGSNGGAGDFTGTNPPGTYNFQLLGSQTQNQTDGPAPRQNTDSTYVNNALVINLPEQFVNGSHMLYPNNSTYYCVLGRKMGMTKEANPRTIVYVDSWPVKPVIAKITGQYQSTPGGVYYGRIVQGQFVNGSNFGYSFALNSLSSEYLPSVDTCWITNNWEQTYGTPNHDALAVGTYVWGLMVGFPAYSVADGTSSYDTWYQVYTWFPPQSATLTHTIQNLETTQTAGTSYTSNEQTMLNNLKTDLSNIQAALANLYSNLKAAGYSL